MLYMMLPLDRHFDSGFGAVADSFRDAADALEDSREHPNLECSSACELSLPARYRAFPEVSDHHFSQETQHPVRRHTSKRRTSNPYRGEVEAHA